MNELSNFTASNKQREFYVFIDPTDFLTELTFKGTRSFTSGTLKTEPVVLPFLPNSQVKDFISPFVLNIIWNYNVECSLEFYRTQNSLSYPSRLKSIFLFESLEEAKRYLVRHKYHVANRLLKRCRTKGSYICSFHDSSWIDFLRLRHSIDERTSQFVCSNYWQGNLAENYELQSLNRPWKSEPIIEYILLGRVEFEDASLEQSSCLLYHFKN